jgi:ligand-binding sensor domain-containing protein/signal transduction histidine kinase
MQNSPFRSILCALFISFISPPSLAAQSTDIRFEHLTVDQGLSSNEVTAILQDSRGFMWFGTGGNGLDKYDGYAMTTYKTDLLDSTSMSGNWINTLVEDSHGDLWINAAGTLNRFDRVTGRICRHLSDQHVTSMCEDTSAGVSVDGLWFTTLGQGMYRYDRGRNAFTAYRHTPNDSNTISSDSAFCEFLDAANMLWVGTAKGLNSLDKMRRRFVRYASGPRTKVYTVFADPDQPARALWIGADDGLYMYDRSSDSFSRYRNNLGNPKRHADNDVRTTYCDRKGRFWVGMKGGIARFDRSTRQYVSYQGGLWADTWGYVNKAWSVCEDRGGTMWMVSQWGPLRTYDERKNEWTPVQIMSDHEILFHALCEDRSGTVWFGTVADAVLKFDRARKPFSFYTNMPGDSTTLSSATVTGICEDASGAVWVGTLRGLNKLNPSTGKFTRYKHDDRNPLSLGHDEIWPILEDHAGKLWIGTNGGGLDEFDKNTQRFIHHRNITRDSLSLASNQVYSLCESNDGRLWIGAGGTVNEFVPELKIFRRHPPGYPKATAWSEVRAILEDHAGLIWIANPGGGLNSYRRSTDQWTQYVRDSNPGKSTKSIGDMGVRSLCEDRRGTLWVGTDGGLFRFERQSGTFTPFSVREGLRNDYVDAILEDGKGCLWLCTANGLSRFDPLSATFRNYDASDGVVIGQCRLPTGHKNRKGEMFFGGSKGLLRFHPDSIQDNPYVPPIVITEFKKFDTPVPLDSAISEKTSLDISYKENVFSFEFAALNYTSPEKNQYAYKLEGFDADWTYCGTRRFATYTNIDGGNYIFRVRGSNNDGVWNEVGASIAVSVTPPFWKKLWFTTLFWLVIAGSVGGTMRYIEMRRLKRRIELLEQQQALEQERLRISQDMHDEVGATLTQISILSELARTEVEGSGESASHVERISEKSREVIDNIGEIIWAINPNNDQLENLVAYLRQYALQYFKSSHITCRFEAPDDLPPLLMSAQARRNIFLVCKESMHNVMKHSQAAEFTFMLRQLPRGLEIRMEDDGKGFSPEDLPGFGSGLKNMKRRMEEIGGTLTIGSRSGRGTCVALAVPYGESSSAKRQP